MMEWSWEWTLTRTNLSMSSRKESGRPFLSRRISMDTILQSLHELEGVNGSIVADGGGRILGYRAHAVYDADLLQQVSKQIVSAVDSIKLIQEDWDAITAQFSEGKLLIRNLTNSARQNSRVATLAVIADARLNV